jgi:hypothetical protein
MDILKVRSMSDNNCTNRFVEASKQAGIPFNEDYNGNILLHKKF